jgi:hypothetical protein
VGSPYVCHVAIEQGVEVQACIRVLIQLVHSGVRGNVEVASKDGGAVGETGLQELYV